MAHAPAGTAQRDAGTMMAMSRFVPPPPGIVDRFILALDRGLRTLGGVSPGSARPSPAAGEAEAPMSMAERRHAVGLMRVDHAGEVAAQALYHGQALTARDARVRAAMERAAQEEGDHLHWCRERLGELGGAPSRLDALWYAGSFLIGAGAGVLGDRVSLGFVAETERQVVAHLDGHLDALPAADRRSRAILARMREDEGRHATAALEAGGAELPGPVKRLMTLASRVMTGLAYRL